VKYKRTVLAVVSACICGIAFSVAAPSAPASGPASHAARSRVLVGVGDNDITMFTNKWFTRLPIKIARYGIDWNAAVTRSKTEVNAFKAWLQAANAAGVQPMVAFGAPAGKAGNYIPKTKQYTRAIKAFVKKFPTVKVYSPWNEPEFIYRSLARKPGLAAAYFNALVRACRGCTIVAGDFYRPANQGLGSWIKAYKKGLRFKPKAWAIHPYNDVRGHNANQIRTLERYVGHAQIWLDEISGVLRRGHWPYPNQSAAAANRDEKYLFNLPKRFHNITRIYHYQWQGVAHIGWDSGLLGFTGKPRPAYWTFAKAVKGKLT
jgi:hypothetical protein